jgi:hypothetical protein
MDTTVVKHGCNIVNITVQVNKNEVDQSESQEEKLRDFNPLQYCLIISTQKTYIKVNTNNRSLKYIIKLYADIPHVSVSYFSFHPATFQTSKSDKWHLSLSHFIDFKELPIRYKQQTGFRLLNLHHNLPQYAVTRTHNQPKVTTPKLECDSGNFASDSIASNKTYILWRVRLGMLCQSCTDSVDLNATTERSHNVESDCINKRALYCGCNTPPL